MTSHARRFVSAALVLALGGLGLACVIQPQPIPPERSSAPGDEDSTGAGAPPPFESDDPNAPSMTDGGRSDGGVLDAAPDGGAADAGGG